MDNNFNPRRDTFTKDQIASIDENVGFYVRINEYARLFKDKMTEELAIHVKNYSKLHEKIIEVGREKPLPPLPANTPPDVVKNMEEYKEYRELGIRFIEENNKAELAGRFCSMLEPKKKSRATKPEA